MEKNLQALPPEAPEASQPEAVSGQQRVLSHFEIQPKLMDLIVSVLGKRPWLEVNDVLSQIQKDVRPVFKD